MPSSPSYSDYSATHIDLIEGLAAVRKRPGMYIGGVGVQGLHQLVWELVDNAIDEAQIGECTRIDVCIHADGTMSVADNGRGIPVDLHPKEGCSALELVMTRLHAGGKFKEGMYNASAGTHGVGVSCVNATAAYLEVVVQREGKTFRQTYRKGVPEGPVQEIGPAQGRGTKVLFQPDPEIFEVTTFHYERIAERLQELAYLNSRLTIQLTDLRHVDEGGMPRATTFYAEDGLQGFVRYVDSRREALLPQPIVVEGREEQLVLEAVIAYNTGASEQMISFVNSVNTREGGTHVVGFRRGFTRAMKAYGKQSKIFERMKVTPSGEDFRGGLTAILSIKVPQPQFSGQEKTRFASDKVASQVELLVYRALQVYLEEHPKEAKVIMDKGVLNCQARQAARQARELVQRKSVLASAPLPGKLADCADRDPARCELFLLEGDSAAGTAKQGRRRDIQAILPLRGKILNVEKSQEYKIYENEQIRQIIAALGIVIEEAEGQRVLNLKKLRYHKIVLMTDADVDGAHILTLLLTLFYRFFYEIIEQGYLYIARPPLYLVTRGKRKRYCWTEQEKEAAMEEFAQQGKGEVHAQHFKGLGEMNSEQLWEVCLNPDTRVWQQVVADPATKIHRDHVFSALMGDDVASRKAFIESYTRHVTRPL